MNRIEKVRALISMGLPYKLCDKALDACNEDLDQAKEWINEHRRDVDVEQKSIGVIATKVHMGRIGAMIEVSPSSDFAARSPVFMDLVNELLLQLIAGQDGPFERQFLCHFPGMRVEELIADASAKLKEPIKIIRSIRWEVGK